MDRASDGSNDARKTCVCGDGDQSDFVGLLCYTAIMPRRRKSRRSILERFMPVRASDFCNENLGDCFCGYPPPFAWPFMQKLRASRARVWFEHKTSGLLHKLGFQWTRCNFGGRRPWFICQCGKRVAKLYDTGSIVACRHCLDTIYEFQRRGENGRKYLRACLDLRFANYLGFRADPPPDRSPRRCSTPCKANSRCI